MRKIGRRPSPDGRRHVLTGAGRQNARRWRQTRTYNAKCAVEPAGRSVKERVAMQPVASRNIKFISHSDLGGRGDGVQVMVHRGFAYIGHGFSNGITIVDVRDAKNPNVVDFIACPPGTRAIHLQTHDDLLLAVNAPSVWTMQEFQDEKAYFGVSPADKLKDQSRFTAGIRIYDISKLEKPTEI